MGTQSPRPALRLQKPDKTSLIKVVIRGEGFQDPFLDHEKKTDRITQRPGLVRPLPQELQGLAVLPSLT